MAGVLPDIDAVAEATSEGIQTSHAQTDILRPLYTKGLLPFHHGRAGALAAKQARPFGLRAQSRQAVLEDLKRE
ncbi:hypothetical protein ASF84_07350 [Pseudomonas sp. Leaf127]|nr:hypothetical protein ASF84_07350 [Pseudomonas sp. Leaf127]